jgi:hypothetical protein
MSQDELAEINGVKPKVLLLDGEEKEVSSMSRYEHSKHTSLNRKSKTFYFLQ